MTPTMDTAPTNSTMPAFVTAPLSQADKQRRACMGKAWDAYKGNFPFPLKKKNGKDPAPENAISNRCAPIVDTGIDFLFGDEISIELGDPSDDASTINDIDKQNGEAALAAVWGDKDDQMTLLGKIGKNGGICGHPFVRILPNSKPGMPPRLINVDPQTVSVITDDDDCETVLAYIIEYDIPQANGNILTKRLAIWRVDPDGLAVTDGGYDEDDFWLMQASQRRGENGKYELVGDMIVWPFPFAPIVDCQNYPNPNDFWGITDLPEHIIKLNETLNFSQSNANKILKHHAHPKTIAIGTEAAQISNGVDDTTCLPEGATMLQLEMHGDLGSSFTFQANIRADMDEESHIPAVALGRLDNLPGTISGVALQTIYRPLLQKTTIKRRLYGRLIREISRRVLAIMGIIEYDPYLPVTIHWPDMLPVDDLAAAQTALAWSQLGVSDDTLMSRNGFDPVLEASKKADENAASAQAFNNGQGMIPPTNLIPQPQGVDVIPNNGGNNGSE